MWESMRSHWSELKVYAVTMQDRSALSMSKIWWPLGQRIIETSPQKITIYCLLQNWVLHTHKYAHMWILTYAYIGICKLCCSVTQSCPSLCDPMACSMPSFPVLPYLPEFAQIHVHWVSDIIQPSHPLLPQSPPALNPSQNQGLFHWVSTSHQVVKVLELQDQSFQWVCSVDFF